MRYIPHLLIIIASISLFAWLGLMRPPGPGGEDLRSDNRRTGTATPQPVPAQGPSQGSSNPSQGSSELFSEPPAHLAARRFLELLSTSSALPLSSSGVTATRAQLEAFFQNLVDTLPPHEALEASIAAVAALDSAQHDDALSSLATNAGGKIMRDVLAADGTLHEFAHLEFLSRVDTPFAQSMLAVALLGTNCYPEQYLAMRGITDTASPYNQIPAIEYDFLEVALSTESSHLRSTLFGNLPNSLNYGVIDAAFQYLASSSTENDLALALDMAKHTILVESTLRSQISPAYESALRDSELEFVEQLSNIGRQKFLTRGEFTTLIEGLHDLGHTSYAVELIADTTHQRFDQDYLDHLAWWSSHHSPPTPND